MNIYCVICLKLTKINNFFEIKHKIVGKIYFIVIGLPVFLRFKI